MKASHFFCVLFLFLPVFLFAQNHSTIIKGKVFDEQKRPLQGVSIYINNSSIHTETDSSGAFQLTIPANVFKKTLLIYKQNFQTKFISNYEEETDLLITLLTDKLLDEVKITAKRSSLVNRKIAIFKKILFGNSTYTKQCELVNIEDLVLNIKSNSQFEVSFKNNIKILNHAFGYMIEVHFERVLISHEKTFAPLNNDNYYCIFKELSPEDSKEAAYWKKNREEGVN
jgi:CarboxypepD_reg-like domain